MSNLETRPAELTCTSSTETDTKARGRLFDARDVPLGGPRAMTVRRTLPQRARSLIGAWCFVDHYGPDDVSRTGGMRVPGHPHTGLQTVSWLFDGEVEHRDTAGTHALVRPGELNLMTAGSGIAHSEYSTPRTTLLHGAQLWIALPDRDRFTTPRFDHYAPPVREWDGARVLVFLGSLMGETSPVATYTDLLGAEITLRAGQTLRLDVASTFEHGVLVDTGEVTVAGTNGGAGQLIYLPQGSDQLTVASSADAGARVLLLGGRPLGEQLVMWWNFVGRSHEEIQQARTDWMEGSRFGEVRGCDGDSLPAPALPSVSLKPRGQAG